jgi:hypothetical protein
MPILLLVSQPTTFQAFKDDTAMIQPGLTPSGDDIRTQFADESPTGQESLGRLLAKFGYFSKIPLPG